MVGIGGGYRGGPLIELLTDTQLIATSVSFAEISIFLEVLNCLRSIECSLPLSYLLARTSRRFVPGDRKIPARFPVMGICMRDT